MKAVAILAVAITVAACSSPPATPHTVSQTADTWCATCHLEGEKDAPVTPHPQRRNCLGCHTPTGTVDVGAFGTWAPNTITLARPQVVRKAFITS